MMYMQTLTVAFDPTTETEEIKRFMVDNPDCRMIATTGCIAFKAEKIIWSQKEEKKDA